MPTAKELYDQGLDPFGGDGGGDGSNQVETTHGGEGSAFEGYHGYVSSTPGSAREVYNDKYSYWERPENVAVTYDAIQKDPDKDWASLGIDKDWVSEQYNAMAELNGSDQWWNWKPAGDDDPLTSMLQGQIDPAKEAQFNPLYQPDFLPEGERSQAATPTTLPSSDKLNDLTGWQKFMVFAQSNGALSGVVNMLPWMAMGAAGGFIAGNVPGAIIGALGAGIAGGVMGWAGSPITQESARKRWLAAGYSPKSIDFLMGVGNGALKLLNLPAEVTEQAIGTTVQYGEAWLPSLPYRIFGYEDMLDDYIKSQDDIKFLNDNIGDVWESSRLTYEAAATTALGGQIAKAPAAIEWLVDMARDQESDVQFTEAGEIYTLDSPDPVKLNVVGAAILNGARNQLIAGKEAPSKVIERWQKMTGFSGQFADMMYQSFADPLNVMPKLERSFIMRTADLTNNKTLSSAARLAADGGEGAVGTFRVYGDLLRHGKEGAPSPWDMTRFQRYLADVTPEGVFKELTPKSTTTRVKRGLLAFAESPLSPVVWWQSAKELTPKSKIKLWMDTSKAGIGEFIESYHGDIEGLRRDLPKLWALKPGELKKLGDKFGNPEMYTIRQGLADFEVKLDELLSHWDSATDQRQLIARIAQVTDTDYVKMVSELRQGGAKEAGVIYKRFVDQIRKVDPNHPILSDPGFTPEAIIRAQDVFKRTPFASDPGWFSAQLNNEVMDHLIKWGHTAFDVKPDAQIVQMGAAIKAVQSLILLDFNPAYLFNNVINNQVTMAVAGVGGYVGPQRIQEYLDWIGPAGGRAKEGAGFYGETMVPAKQKFATFEQAMEEGGLDAAMAWADQDLMQKGMAPSQASGWLAAAKRKLPSGPMRKISGKAESKQSVIAHYNGTMQAWSRLWNRNGSIPKMPGDVKAGLDRIDPRLANIVMSAIESARRPEDIRATLANLDTMQRRADPYLDQVAAQLGHDPKMMRELLVKTNTLDNLNGYLKQGMTVDEAVSAVARDIEEISATQHGKRMLEYASKGGALMRSEGLVAGATTMHDMLWDMEEFWSRSFRDNGEVFERVKNMLPAERNRVLDDHFRSQDAKWRRQFELNEATWRGFLLEAGFSNPGKRSELSVDAQQYLGAITKQHNDWANFYVERKKRLNKFYKDSRNQPPERTSALWREFQNDLAAMYDTYAARELDGIRPMGQIFLRMWDEQYGGQGREGVAFWWRGVYETTQKRQEMMKDMRAWERGETPTSERVRAVTSGFNPATERHKAWQPFVEKVYLPAIGETTQANLFGTKVLSDAATGRRLPEEMKGYVEWLTSEDPASRPLEPWDVAQRRIEMIEQDLVDIDMLERGNVFDVDRADRSIETALQEPTLDDGTRAKLTEVRAALDVIRRKDDIDPATVEQARDFIDAQRNDPYVAPYFGADQTLFRMSSYDLALEPGQILDVINQRRAVNDLQPYERYQDVPEPDVRDAIDYIGREHTAQQRTINMGKWFGESKVVNTDGAPMVVYHGTRANFTKFDTDAVHVHDTGFYGEGIYLTPSQEMASDYAMTLGGEGGNVMPLYARVERPFETWDATTMLRRWGATSAEQTANMKKAGYDGVFKYDVNNRLSEIVAFDDNQVKSVANNGDYSDDPDVLLRRGDVWRFEEYEQEITSAATSINSAKLPAVFSAVEFAPGTRNADIGGGRFDNATEALAARGVDNVIFDPFNRTKEFNDASVERIRDGQSDTATVSNVLNVIREQGNRDTVIRQAANAIKDDGVAYFTIYEGDASNHGEVTRAGWQNNRKTDAYMEEIKQHFGDVKRKGNMIEARQPKRDVLARMDPETLYRLTRQDSLDGKTMKDVYWKALADEGWQGGERHLLNAVNADRKKAGLAPYAKAEDVPLSEALTSYRTHNPGAVVPVNPNARVEGLVQSFTKLGTISREEASGLAALVEGNAKYLGMGVDEYLDTHLRGVKGPGIPDPEDHVLYKFARDDDNMVAYRDYLANEGSHMVTSDTQDYVSDILKWCRSNDGVDENGNPLSPLKSNEKTFLSIDITGECPYTAQGRPCLYCYVEQPRAVGSPKANIKYGTASYNGELAQLKQYPQFVKFMNERMGGIRVFSIGDIRPQDVPTLHRVVQDAAEAGLLVKFITKNERTLTEFLQYKNTRFNLSVDWLPQHFNKALAPQIRENLAKIIREEVKAANPGMGRKDLAAEVERQLQQNVDLAQSILADPSRVKAVSYGWDLETAMQYRTDNPEQVKIRYVAMNGMDNILATFNPNIDVVTAWHGNMKDPRKLLELAQVQNAYLTGIGKDRQAQLFGWMDDQFGFTKFGVTTEDLMQYIRTGKTDKDLDVINQILSSQVGDDNFANLSGYASRIRIKAKEDLWQSIVQTKVWKNLVDSGKIDVWLKENNWDPSKPPPGGAEQVVSLASKYKYQLAAHKADTVKGVYRPATPGDPDWIALSGKRDTGSGITFEKPVPFSEPGTPAGGHSGESTWGDILTYLQRYTYRPYLGNKATRAIVSVFEQKMPDTFWGTAEGGRTKSTVTKADIEAVVGSKLTDEQYEAALDVGAGKNCCQTGRCGTCGVQCAFGPLAIKATLKQKLLPEVLYRVMSGEPLASIAFDLDNRAVIRGLTESTNVRDVSHELGHMFRRTLRPDDMRIAEEWAGVEPGSDVWSVAAEEKFAEGFELYLAEGNAPTARLKTVFDRFKSWLTAIFSQYKDKPGVVLTDQMRGLYARMLGADPSQGITYQRYQQPRTISGMAINGAAYVGGKFAAYTPARFEGKVFSTGTGPARILGIDTDGKWVYRLANGDLRTLADGDANIPTVGPFLPGTLESRGGTPIDYSQVMQNGFDTFTRPILDGIAREMRNGLPIGGKLEGLDQAGATALRNWMGEVDNAMASTKRASIRMGDLKRDFSLLNYSERYGLDTAADLIFPYQFWFTRSMVNWAARMWDKPGMLAFFNRLATFTDDELDDKYKVVPTRLKQDLRIPVPWLEKLAPWTGGALYVDPWGKLFPFREFLRPWEQYMNNRTRVEKTAESILMRWADQERVTKEEAQAAIDTWEGDLWEKAMAEASETEGGDIVDFMSVMSSPSLPLSLAIRGPNKTGPFPASRMIQGLAAVTGWDGIASLDPEGQIRKSMGLSEFGEWGPYYIDRHISNMVADGTIDPSRIDEVVAAMIEHKGPIYDQAIERARMELALKQPGLLPILAARNVLEGDGNILDILGASLITMMPGGLLPTGELEQRGLGEEYSAAWQSYHSGDKEALNTFFTEHPEYRARLALYDEGEERLRQVLISNIWDKRSKAPYQVKQWLDDGLGKEYQTTFLDKDTRDYDALSTQVLAEWSRAFGGYYPEGTEEVIEVPGAAQAQDYAAEKARLYPGVDAIMPQYWKADNAGRAAMNRQYPQIVEYLNWEAQYLNSHPDLIPLFAGPDDPLVNADNETQRMVQLYRSEKARVFPDIAYLLNEYYAREGQARKDFGRANPTIYEYFDWNDNIKKQLPEIKPYVTSQANSIKSMLGDQYINDYGAPPTNIYDFPQEVLTQLEKYFVGSAKLGPGAKDYLYLQWEKQGKPVGTYDKWLKSLGVFYGK